MNQPVLSDRTLIECIVAGAEESEPAFEELYKRYSRKLYLFSVKFLGNRTTAKDVVQETFISFLTHVRKGNRIDSLPAFLFKSARNKCLTNARRNLLDFGDPTDIYEDVTDNTPDNSELYGLISAALADLPPQYREALMMHVYGGLSYSEICHALGASLPVVRHRISRAKQRLRSIVLPQINP